MYLIACHLLSDCYCVVSWELARASAPWGVRYSASLVLVNDGMVMAGGASDANTVWPDVWISDDLGSQ